MVRNKRCFLRPIEDYPAGAMTSMHSLITKKGEKLRGTLTFRDCDSEISFEFWDGEGARPGGKERAVAMLGLIQDELAGFLQDFIGEDTMTATDQDAWDSFFAEVTGWTFHPGYYRENATKPTIEECAAVADEMLRVRNERLQK